MKKAIAFVCMLMLSISLVACGNKTDDQLGTTKTTDNIETTDTTGTTNETGTTLDVSGETNTGVTTPDGWSAEMETIKSAVVDALGDSYVPNAKMSAGDLETLCGISSDLYDDYLGEVPMISVNVDSMIIIKAKEDKLSEVEDAMSAYRDSLVNSTLQYPMNIGKIQASRIEIIGNYVCFLQLGGDTSSVNDDGEEAVIKHCQEQNELAIEILYQTIEI